MNEKQRMVGAMTRMALFRQAEVSTATYVAYALALTEQGIDAGVVEAACRSLEATTRAEGETAFPSLGTLLSTCHGLSRGRWGDWKLECQALHGGRCSNVFFHEAMKG